MPVYQVILKRAERLLEDDDFQPEIFRFQANSPASAAAFFDKEIKSGRHASWIRRDNGTPAFGELDDHESARLKCEIRRCR